VLKDWLFKKSISVAAVFFTTPSHIKLDEAPDLLPTSENSEMPLAENIRVQI
jgi:hypothetical protein